MSKEDSEYKTLLEKCNNRYENTFEIVCQTVSEGFLWFKNRIYVPNQSDIKKIIFRELDDSPSVGHPGY